jgi:hypothetical protein
MLDYLFLGILGLIKSVIMTDIDVNHLERARGIAPDSGFPLFGRFFWPMVCSLIYAASTAMSSKAISVGIDAVLRYLESHPEMLARAPKCFFANSIDEQDRSVDEVLVTLRMHQLGNRYDSNGAADNDWRDWPTRPR